MALAVDLFFEPNGLVIGGASGAAILIQSVVLDFRGVSIPLAALFLLINLPVFGLGLAVLGKKAARGIAGAALLSFMLWICEFLPVPETDLPLAVLFGGVITGLGLGLILETGYSTGGTDLLAGVINRWLPSARVSFIIFVADFVIIGLGLWEFGAKNTLYALISIFITVKVIDVIITGAGFSEAVFIITEREKHIAERLMAEVHRGVTTLRCTGEYSGKEKGMIFCVIKKKQLYAVKRIVKESDPRAFVTVASAAEVVGEGFAHIKE